MHIAISGNIGSGKTTLAGLLSRHYSWDVLYEDVETNPYLVSFYEDMHRWAFNLQIYFLRSRLQQIINIRNSPTTVIQDRTIYEDAFIFAPNLLEMGLMSERDYQNYFDMFKLMMSFIKPPDLLIYLRASVPTLVNQIQKRGRSYETSIRLDYLQHLNERYEHWINNYKEGAVLIIDVNTNKFPEDNEDLGKVISSIDAKLFGLFK